MAMH
jgi:hypothetical protein